MGIYAERYHQGDFWVFYDFEDVLFRWESATGKYYRKFVDHANEKERELPRDNRLLSDALRWGDEITAEVYGRGTLSTDAEERAQ
jgi:hypothetical protein